MLPEALVSRDDLRDFGLALLTTETCFKLARGPLIRAIGDHRRILFSFSLACK
jgi:GntR family transcriptional regulator